MNSKKILAFMLLVSVISFSTFALDLEDITDLLSDTNAKNPATFNTENISAGLDDFTFSLIKTQSHP